MGVERAVEPRTLGPLLLLATVERLLEPFEVAALLVWLAGPESSGVTGAAVPVDGGLTV